MNYVLVFDVTDAGYRQWWFPAFGLIFVALGAGILIYLRMTPSIKRNLARRVIPYFFTGFAVFWVTITFLGTFRDYWLLRQAMRSGAYEIVEGRVTDFVPEPTYGHAFEHFKVNGRHFEYGAAVVTAGFNKTQAQGGPIHEGLQVRIYDVKGKIARLEIAH